ncbi:AfsA-related hotdog domain-containing protein [Streptomyces sp. NPDC003077]|uniref:AfsA-related hotdog domain-containing protein n=1 Tax=Streptomyces sp. NPDC003077 TaxID=3154443 RepID=UPI0033AB3C79
MSRTTHAGTPAAVARRPARETPPPVLAGDATVPRQLVHKRSVEHVFVTDVRLVDDRPTASAQLPRLHRFYNDAPTPHYDLLLIGEAARQCCEAMAHRLLGVPADAAFVMHDLTVEMLDPAAFRVAAVPTDMVLQADRPAGARHGGAAGGDGGVRRVDGDAVCWIAGRPAARFAGTLVFLSQEGYAQLRHGAAAAVGHPTTAAAGGGRADAARVGRRDPANVVVAEPETTPEETRARLLVDAVHPVFFEHPQDHYPGMALLEGCRQTAVAAAAAATGVPPHRLLATRCEARFHRYAELGPDVDCHAVPVAAPGGVVVRARAAQSGTDIAGAELRFTVLDDAAGPSGAG